LKKTGVLFGKLQFMKYRRLGKTGLRVSVIGVGTWQLGGEWGKKFQQKEVDEMFDAARETGINLIDTAECYGDHESERLVGAAIQRDRQNWIVATKFGHAYTGFSQRRDERAPWQAAEQVEASLEALQTDYIDLLQYHSVRDSEFENDDLTAVLMKLIESGKVRHLGNSVGKSEGMLHQTEASTRRHVETIQCIYNRLDRLPEEKAFAMCIAQDLGVLARVPLASGFLSGKYDPGAKFAANDVRSEKDSRVVDQRLQTVREIAAKEVPAGVPMAQWALAWCLQHPAVSCVIPGCKNVQQVRSNAAAADLEMVRADHPQAWK
jgi:myo-inositol catabolism protein IolS